MGVVTLVRTAIGRVGLAATDEAIAGLLLPDPSDDETLAHLERLLEVRFGARFERVEPRHPRLTSVAARVAAHLEGAHDDLRSIALDWTGLTPFRVRASEAARAIPVGEVRSYGELARSLGSPGASRAVGSAMGKNPFPIIVPCHRVVGATSAKGRVAPGGFSAHGGLVLKARLLGIERAACASSIAPR